MKNLYNTIEQNLKAGLIVVVKDLRDNYCFAIGTNKDDRGNYRYSGWEKNIKDAKQFIGLCAGYDKDYWDEKDLEIVEVYRPEYEPFKVGDKVRILDSIKKTGSWEYFEKYFPDMTGEIKEVCFEPIGINYAVNGCWIGHEYLAPLNEIKEETIKIGDHIYSKKEVEKRLQGLKEI
jgi:hypothetical protein